MRMRATDMNAVTQLRNYRAPSYAATLRNPFYHDPKFTDNIRRRRLYFSNIKTRE
jgi:hypothetical protein